MALSWQELSSFTKLSEAELRQELAALYRDRKLNLGKAAKLAALSQGEFLSILAEKGITVDYTVADLEEDIKTIAALTD